jgi:hypothetical protein
MLQVINDLPPHVIGIHGFSDVTETEYRDSLVPLIDDLLKRNKKINFILILESDIKNFTFDSWLINVNIGFNYFWDWNKIAVVTDQGGLFIYSDIFKIFIPGKFRKFALNELDKAFKWVAER